MPQLESAADTRYQLQLPTVSFRIIEDDKSLLAPAGVNSEQIRTYGYNDFSEFERPEHYIRHIEPIESELATQVEYDMDEQDKEWLDVVNGERKKNQAGAVSYELFEIIMDKLEKEWFNLIKRIPQPASHMPVEDSRCSICDDGEGENSNAIVFCDGCNLAVHQDCYGVPYIPEGQWLCRKCTVSPENPVSCIFCPNEGGAFKQTTTGHWSHLLCAIWIPELTVGNAIYMEPVQDVEQLPKSRWKLVCSLCRERVGACIQCDNRTCFTAFHVTCARQAGLLMTMKTLGTEGILRAFCDKHLPAEMRDALESDDDESEFEDSPKFHSRKPKARRRSSTRKIAVTTKTARAHAKSYRPGPPIVPQMIVNKLIEYVQKVSLSKRQGFVEQLCRYWSLKREARRGAPLLKRLHLEPWTASSASKQQTEAEKAVKLKFLTMLRNDLDKVRMLAELSRKREREKLRQAQVIKDIVDSFLFPSEGKLRLTLEKISAMDRQDLFLHHVNRVDVPDYYQVIKEPMCWAAIDAKLEKNEYRRIEDFTRDINLVLDNAMTYNSPDTQYHRIAKRIKTSSQELLDNLLQSPQPSAEDDGDSETGDLEPPRHLLEALLAPLTDSTEGETTRDRLADLFSFELEPPKEPTPPPPTPPPPKRRETGAEKRKRWEEREAQHQLRLAAAGRATRAGHAKEEAFKHEAGLPLSSPGNAQPEAGPSIRRTRKSMANADQTLQVPQADEAGGRVRETSATSRSRSQVGVVRTEPVERLSDKERREREKALALAADSIGNKDQFARFNVGWVLPEGSKRRRTESAQVPPAPKVKAARHATSDPIKEAPAEEEADAPVVTAAEAILAPPSPLTPEASTRDSSLTPASEVPTPVPTSRRSRGKRRADAPPPAPSPLKQVASSSIAPKRQSRSSMERAPEQPAAEEPPRKSARRSRGAAAAATQADAEEADTTGGDEIAVESIMAEVEDDAMTPAPQDSDDLTPMPSSTPRVDAAVANVQTEAEPASVNRRAIGKLSKKANDPSQFEPYSLVWAKMDGFPYFPAQILIPEKDSNVNSAALAAQRTRAAGKQGNIPVFLVQFFDSKDSYGWIPINRLTLLGVEDAVDQDFLALKENGKTKSGASKQKHAVRQGYRDALAAFDANGVEQEEGE